MDNQRDKRLEEIRKRTERIINIEESEKCVWSDSRDGMDMVFLLEEIDRLQRSERILTGMVDKWKSEVSQLREERDTLKEALTAIIKVGKKDEAEADRTIKELTEEAKQWLRERNDLREERDILQQQVELKQSELEATYQKVYIANDVARDVMQQVNALTEGISRLQEWTKSELNITEGQRDNIKSSYQKQLFVGAVGVLKKFEHRLNHLQSIKDSPREE